MLMTSNIDLSSVENYYTSKLRAHGATARGVDWNGEASQYQRFEQLLRVVPHGAAFSLNDLGCGYGALLAHLPELHSNFSYTGIDLSQAMIDEARRLHDSDSRARFYRAGRFEEPADYTVASGIFNVRPSVATDEWEVHMEATLAHMNSVSRKGFAFNCLTKYSDPEKMRPHLHYADPCKWFDHCERRYARAVALLHDYGLYEFTIIVRKGA